MIERRLGHLILGLTILSLWSCRSGEPITDARVSDGAYTEVNDAGMSEDIAMDSAQADTTDGMNDMRSDQAPCVTPAVGDPSRVNFFKPDHPENVDWPAVRAFYESRNPEPPFRSVFFALAPYLEPNPGAVEVGYLARDEEFLASVMVANYLDSLPEHRVYISVLKNYEPVEATYIRWLDNRGGESTETTSTGIMIDDLQTIELVDIHIQNEEFDIGGNEMALMIRSGRPNRKANDSMRRFTIFRDEFSWPDPPCYLTDQVKPLTEIEESIVQNIDFGLNDDLLKTSDTISRDEIRDEIQVGCGEVVPVDYTIINTAFVGQRNSSVLFLNGVPLPHRWHYIPAEFDGGTAFTRGQVEIRMPDTPGRYDLFLQRWVDSYQTYKEPWAIQDDTSFWSLDGSNLLQFRVMCSD